MSFAVLGTLEVRLDGRPVEVGGQRLRTLLGLLLLDPGRTIGLDALIDGVWGDRPPAGVGNALQALVSRLRSALGAGAGLVTGDGSGYRLAVEPGRVDAHRFARLAAEGSDALAAGASADAARILRSALGLWRGPAYADLAGNDLATAEITRLEALRLTATEDRLEADLRLGRHAEVLAETPALIAAHPLRERMHGQRMRALYGQGRQVEALAAYEEARAGFADRLGADPSPALSGLHTAMLRGEWREPREQEPAADEPAPAAAPGERRGNLRAALTSFVGREAEVAKTGGLLAEHRLVTLIGPGGAGKTRLAIETARAVGERIPGGTWLAELAPVADPREVPQAVLTALGVRDPLSSTAHGVRRPADDAETDATARLVRAVGRRELLIVLDNCEHLIDAAARLADRLVAECPGLRVLATSREPLGIIGEALWPVGSLALPSREGSAEEILRAPAVRLFTDRAATARPGFDPAADTGSIARICRDLDGLPLAIELAAARLRSLSAAQIADRLSDRFRLLTGGSRTALPRHQTLRAVVSWSWDLLDDAERTLAARLSVFAGGTTLAGTESVCAGGGLERADVFDVLARLVDKSLVLAEADRYRMLETVRAYAAERLAESGEERRVRLAHARFHAELAEAAEPGLRGHDQLKRISELTADQDNLSTAVRWATEEGERALALRLVGALGWYWWLVGHRLEGAHRAHAALAIPGGETDVDPRALAHAHAAFGINAADVGMRWEEARVSLETAIRIGTDSLPSPLPPMIAVLDTILALFIRKSMPQALEVAARLSGHPDPWVVGVGQLFRGMLLINGGRVAEGQARVEEALWRFREIGERWGIGNAMAVLSELGIMRGDAARSVREMRDAISVMDQIGAGDDTVYLRSRLAIGLNMIGDRAGAGTVLDETWAIVLRSGDTVGQGGVHSVRGDFAREDGDLEAARRHYSTGMNMLGEEAPPQLKALITSSLALLAEAEHDLPRSRRLHHSALAIALGCQDGPVLGGVLIGTAGLALAEDDPARAATLLGAAASIRGFDEVADFDHVRITANAKAALGPGEFSRCYERGRWMQVDEAADFARGTGGRD
ncbi:BTAD domain-containing putative transcriptional regulator [Spongiactinospora sp. TRM90649]|uniref:AfsR/SARP family transcriptional regulator n=1 Tax=Spongiactinospora sp. TRM90649 TaxID=3031114 RepID=UPI0023F63D67|nr:BTAD domain-containing putative transcriptional regulator [Spongiactinospora sp. TRM90649]MDF5757965.1 BTAD domain-containing putative transcriptional regulator [Spongiactinospora sp. TRM90649]